MPNIHLQHTCGALKLAVWSTRSGGFELAAFLIVEIKSVHDQATYARYREEVSENVVAGGGKYLVRGGRVEVLEGDWRPGRVVVVRFASLRAARDWWSSPHYAELKAKRQGSTDTNMILVEGVSDE